MKTALVFLEVSDNKIKKSSLEALSVVYGTDFNIVTVALGAGSDQLSGELEKWGVSEHYSCSELAQYNPELFTNTLAQVFETTKPNLVLASSNSLSKDIFPRLSARFDMGFMSDITEVDASGSLSAKRPMYAGKCSAQVTFTDDSGQILLIRPNQIPVADASNSKSTDMKTLSAVAPSGASDTVSVEKGESEKLDLTEAEVIVSGGRGLKDAENFKMLNDLAEPLGATVGASRAVVDLGWVPHSLQVGQTGKTVAPNLYFAVGISGAIQHLAGMSGSKNIVAINKDDKAPIFQKATYGLVGDLFDIVPLLTEKLKAIR